MSQSVKVREDEGRKRQLVSCLAAVWSLVDVWFVRSEGVVLDVLLTLGLVHLNRAAHGGIPGVQFFRRCCPHWPLGLMVVRMVTSRARKEDPGGVRGSPGRATAVKVALAWQGAGGRCLRAEHEKKMMQRKIISRVSLRSQDDEQLVR
mmetsp:Transcript_27878/g.43505  ORF Transcript_27878/g.43505 Transcript_27878/m.43505 type:complete len:148 (-) Transcript_27878:170-613(-)